MKTKTSIFMKFSFLLLTLTGVFISQKVSAQTPPEAFNYQAVVRNADTLVRSYPVSFTISILDALNNNNIIYRETRSVTTDAFGLVNFEIGTGNRDNNFLEFSNIDWADSQKEYWVNVEIDMADGNGPRSLSKRKLLSVPYALYAKSSGNFFVAGAGLETNTVGSTDSTSVKPGEGIVVDTNGVRIANAGVINAMIQNPFIVINTGNGLSGEDTVFLGTSVSLENTGDKIETDDIKDTTEAGGDLSGKFKTLNIKVNAVGSAEIADDAVGALEIADGTVGSAEIANDAVGALEIADGTVGSAEIANDAVGTSEIANNSITTNDLAFSRLPPNGSAGGDLHGTYPSPSVGRIQGDSVSSVPPTNGQLLQYDNGIWKPVSFNALTTNSSTAERIERLSINNICTTSPCTITSQSGTWVTSVTRLGTGHYKVNFSSNTFSDTPTCVCSGGPANARSAEIFAITSSFVELKTMDLGINTGEDQPFQIICMGKK